MSMILIKNSEEVIREAKHQLHTTMDDYQTKIISIFDKHHILMNQRIEINDSAVGYKGAGCINWKTCCSQRETRV
ncbi:hypothetical protein ACSS31_00590 [Priestia megaterium]